MLGAILFTIVAIISAGCAGGCVYEFFTVPYVGFENLALAGAFILLTAVALKLGADCFAEYVKDKEDEENPTEEWE